MALCPLISAEQRHLLGLGRVPQRRRRTVQRRQLIDRLAQRLKAFLSDHDSKWFLVRGMPGAGKSELVASVLWERPELCFAFFDRVIWITDRHMNPDELAEFAADTLVLVSLSVAEQPTSAIEVFEQTDSNGTTGLASTGEAIASLLENGIHKTLLVLDGVMMAETVRFFDGLKVPNCKFLATSTSQAIFGPVDALQIFVLGAEDFNCEHLREMAQIYGIQENLDMADLHSIWTQTGGNVAMLEKLFTLACGSPAILRSLLSTLRHRPLAELSCHSPYPHANLEGPIHCCMQMLGERLCDSLHYCCVLEPFVWTHFEILRLIWPLDICGGETEMELSARTVQHLDSVEANSLMEKRQSEELLEIRYARYYPFHYRLHPLVLSFLLHTRPNASAVFRQCAESLLFKLRENDETAAASYADYLARNERRLCSMAGRLERHQNDQTKPIAQNYSTANGSVWGGRGFASSLAGTLLQWTRAGFWK